LREFFQVVGDNGTGHRVGEAPLRKADQLVDKGAVPERSKAPD